MSDTEQAHKQTILDAIAAAMAGETLPAGWSWSVPSNYIFLETPDGRAYTINLEEVAE